MTPDQFTNWLSGFISALGDNPPTDKQFNNIKDNLAKVFNKVTPEYRISDFSSKTILPQLDCDFYDITTETGNHLLLNYIGPLDSNGQEAVSC